MTIDLSTVQDPKLKDSEAFELILKMMDLSLISESSSNASYRTLGVPGIIASMYSDSFLYEIFSNKSLEANIPR